MKHVAKVVGEGDLFRASCTCRWISQHRDKTQQQAADRAVEHARAKRRAECGKKRFSLETAEQILLNAKMRSAAGGPMHRREQRYYFCQDCSAYHMTSMPALNPHQERRHA